MAVEGTLKFSKCRNSRVGGRVRSSEGRQSNRDAQRFNFSLKAVQTYIQNEETKFKMESLAPVHTSTPISTNHIVQIVLGRLLAVPPAFKVAPGALLRPQFETLSFPFKYPYIFIFCDHDQVF
jgi:hypothetical protein